jgi:cell wall-associated NlpC family hydrolase
MYCYFTSLLKRSVFTLAHTFIGATLCLSSWQVMAQKLPKSSLSLSALSSADPALILNQGISESDSNVISDLLFHAFAHMGLKYRSGGVSPDTGFDCSGFVKYVYQETFGVSLPHQAAQMSQIGKTIDNQQLKLGDLVFYNTMRRNYSHVGIYLGNNRFIHSPSSGSGIRIESIDDKYWATRFDGARRIL